MTNTPVILMTAMYKRRLAPFKAVTIRSFPHAALCYVTRGSGTVHLDNAQYLAKPNQLYFLLPGMNLEVVTHHAQLEYYLLFVKCLDINNRTGACLPLPQRDIPASLHPLAPGMTALSFAPSIHEYMDHIYVSYQKRDVTPFQLNNQFQQLLALLSEHALPNGQESNAASGIEQSIAYIHRCYAHKIKLNTLAEMAGFTPSSYSREFKRQIGVSPIEYINQHRVAQAKLQLLDKRNSIKKVSALSGFGSEYYFSRVFRKETGVSPTLYMKRTLSNVAVVSCFRFEDIVQSLGIQPVVSLNCRKHRTMNHDEHQLLVEQNLLQLKQASPDLIICDQTHQPFVEQFKQIAPTIVIGYSMDWQVLTKDIAEAIGRGKEAESRLKQLDRKTQQVKKIIELPFKGKTFTFMRVIDKLIRIQGLRNHPLNELLYMEVGLNPGFCVHPNFMHIEFSPNKFPDFGTDYLFVQSPMSPENKTLFHTMTQTPEWNAISAVIDQRIYDTDSWVSLSWSSTGREAILNELLEICGRSE